MKKRILSVVEFFPPLLASDLRVFELARHIHSKEFVFLVIPPYRYLTGKLSEKELLSFHEKRQHSCISHSGINGFFVSVPDYFRLIWKLSQTAGYALTFPLLFFKSFFRVLALGKFDAVLVKDASAYGGLLGYIIARIFGIKCVLDMDDFIAEYSIGISNIRPNGIRAKIILGIQRFLAANSDSVIGATSALKAFAEKSRNRADAKLIHNGIDASLFKPGSHRPAKLCVYCGRLDNLSGAQIVLNLAQLSYSRKDGVKYLMVGEGPLESVTLPNLTIRKTVPHYRVPEILAKADIILVPRFHNRIAEGADPVKLYEAMAMKKPIVASNVSGIADIISKGRNGILCSPDNILEWYNAVHKLLRNRSFAEALAEQAYIDSAKFTWQIQSEKLNQELDKLWVF